jgi:hypothetical protein
LLVAQFAFPFRSTFGFTSMDAVDNRRGFVGCAPNPLFKGIVWQIGETLPS